MPSLPDVLRIRKEWTILAEDRERALAKRHLSSIERYNSHTKSHSPLQVGDTVAVQNKTGNHPLRWDKTGHIVEVREHGQYVIKMDGSGRCTLRNRRFLRRCRAFCVEQAIRSISPMPVTPSIPAKPSTSMVPTATLTLPALQVADDHTTPPDLNDGQNNPRDPRVVCPRTIPEVGCADSSDTQASPCHQTAPLTRVAAPVPWRSSRQRRPRREISPTFRGKSCSTSCRQIPGTLAAVDSQGEEGM